MYEMLMRVIRYLPRLGDWRKSWAGLGGGGIEDQIPCKYRHQGAWKASEPEPGLDTLCRGGSAVFPLARKQGSVSLDGR